MVIQNSLGSLGGGELVCVNTCLALQNLGYHVRLVTDRFEPDEIEAAFGLGGVVRKCEHVKVPQFGRRIARFSSVPGIFFGWRSKQFFEKQYADVVFVTRDPRRPDILPNRPLFRFVYEMSQLQAFWESYRRPIKTVYGALYRRSRAPTTFLAVSSALAQQIKQTGYPAAELVYPSYGRGFRPQPKKNQVVQVTFLAPQKRLDDFMEVARKLPGYKFYLVGRDTERTNRIYKGYAKRILESKPANVEYVETRIRQAPELLEESKIYLHTGTEPGMTIAVMEALSAGCVPVAPREGGAGEIVEAASVGFRYETVEESANFIKSEMDASVGAVERNSPGLTPTEIAEKAKMFSPEAFQNRIEHVIERESLFSKNPINLKGLKTDD
jgi:glycosyltransferase involved in cell wall biosynthesis